MWTLRSKPVRHGPAITPAEESHLSDEEIDRLAEILIEHDADFDIEWFDGLLAALACGPRGISPYEVFGLPFHDGLMPDFETEERALEFERLCGRRLAEWMDFATMNRHDITEDNLVLPITIEPTDEEAALARDWTPPPAGSQTLAMRDGRWPGQQWARGFMRMNYEFKPQWQAIEAIEGGLMALAPLLLLDLGYNPDAPDRAFDAPDYLASMPTMVRELNALFAADYALSAQSHTSVVRAQPKVGRNDPCPCGSGKKYKKCCGA